MKILLISPYDAISHQNWRASLAAIFDEADITHVTLPARYFNWRFRGNSLTLAHDERLQDDYDLLIATSMTDLSALRGMAPRVTGYVNLLYFHENQFSYPDSGDPDHLTERQITSIYSALSADYLIFNSEFNRSTFLSGAEDFLTKMPDGVPAGLVKDMQARSTVIPVAIQVPNFVEAPASDDDQFNIIWNHRWEYDKGLDELEQFVKGITQLKMDVLFHLIGQGFRKIPGQISYARQRLNEVGKLGEFGFIEDRSTYFQLLDRSHLVLSTAKQEFQGLAVLEAMALGCTPVVPDCLAYQEYVPAEFRYQSLEHGIGMIESSYQRFLQGENSVPVVPEIVSLDSVRYRWQDLLKMLL